MDLIDERIRMAIFPARRNGFLPPKRALPAAGTDAAIAAIASAGANVTGYGMFSIGPKFEHPLGQVEVEEISGRWTERRHSVLQAEQCRRPRPSATDLALRAAGPIQ